MREAPNWHPLACYPLDTHLQALDKSVAEATETRKAENEEYKATMAANKARGGRWKVGRKERHSSGSRPRVDCDQSGQRPPARVDEQGH